MRIDIDTCEEILITITRNKTRSLLTAFGVFWGIFMLVALIGGGQGLQDMMQKNFEGFATNSGFLAAQKTGEAYKGFRKGRWWDLEAIDIERLRSQVKDVEVITPSVARWGSNAIYGDKKYDCSVKGLYPDYLHIESQEMAYGRFINDVDIREARKVCVIGKRVYESLFKPGEDPCGKYVRVDGIYYQVIGMSSSEGDMNIPVSYTHLDVYKRQLAIHCNFIYVQGILFLFHLISPTVYKYHIIQQTITSPNKKTKYHRQNEQNNSQTEFSQTYQES